MRSKIILPIMFALTGCSEISFFSDQELQPTYVGVASNSKKQSFSPPTVATPESRKAALMNTWEGCVLLTGWSDAEEMEYDISLLTQEERALYVDLGLLTLESYAESDELKNPSCTILSNYYFCKKDYKKAMYWALTGAENGSGECMSLLSNAYRSGQGVVQDFEEGIKWTYLAAAVGNPGSQKWVSDNATNLLTIKDIQPIAKEAKRRANEWMQEHPEIFLSKD